MADAVAPACLTASATFAKTGRSRCVDPAFFGFVPPTTWVPICYQNLSISFCLVLYCPGRTRTVCDSLFGVETTKRWLAQYPLPLRQRCHHWPSLLSSETLVDDLRVFCDPEVFCSRGICAGRSWVALPAHSALHQRSSASWESLHLDKGNW